MPGTKRQAILEVLKDPEWAQLSNYSVARATESSETYVRRLRGELGMSSHKGRSTLNRLLAADLWTSKHFPSIDDVEEALPIMTRDDRQQIWRFCLGMRNWAHAVLAELQKEDAIPKIKNM